MAQWHLALTDCQADAYELLAVWSSLVQTRGLAQGAFFDPYTFMPLVNNRSVRKGGAQLTDRIMAWVVPP